MAGSLPLSVEFSPNLLNKDELVVYYSLLNYSCKDIQQLLQCVHGHVISVRHLWRLRKKYDVHTRQNESDLNEIVDAIQNELNQSGSLLGYRLMWVRLRINYNLNVRRDTVMMLLNLMDPNGSNLRKSKKLQRRIYRSKGPNFLWHIDGYDKLKPFGITIHGCIDGFSRRIMWLRVANSNNDPKVVAKHFIDCVQLIQGCPSIVRADRGTENCNIAIIQPSLRHYHSDSFAGDKSFIYGRSTANQRIEAFWSQLRRQCTNWWMDFFKDLRDCGEIDCSLPWQEEAARFCFGPVIQQELDCLSREWNHHRIRRYNLSEMPSGIPEILYHLPETAGAYDCKMEADMSLLQEAESSLTTNVEFTSPEFACYAEKSMVDYRFELPRNWTEALQLYFLLIEDMNTLIL